MEKLEITLNDDRNPDDEVFTRLVSTSDWSIFIDRVFSLREKRSLSELVKALLEGK